jgi:hypothetical protein
MKFQFTFGLRNLLSVGKFHHQMSNRTSTTNTVHCAVFTSFDETIGIRVQKSYSGDTWDANLMLLATVLCYCLRLDTIAVVEWDQSTFPFDTTARIFLTCPLEHLSLKTDSTSNLPKEPETCKHRSVSRVLIHCSAVCMILIPLVPPCQHSLHDHH